METTASSSPTTSVYEAISNVTHNYEILFYNAAFEQQNPSLASFTPVLIIAMILSIVFLILSIIVFLKLPEFQNIHGRNLMTMSFCLLTTYICLCVDFAIRKNVQYSSCYVIAVIIHMSWLGFFFWTTVLAFDMWNNIRRIVLETFVENEPFLWKKYIMYFVFAWTATLVAALPAFIFESVDVVPLQSRPEFGRRRCWLSGANAFTYYFNTPVGIIVIVDSFLYIMAMRKIYAIDQLVAYLQGQEQQKRLDLYVRLFFIMALIWFFEFLPWMTHKYWVFCTAELLMALYGFFFSAIFILNGRAIRDIKLHFFGIVTVKKPVTYPTIPIPESWNNLRDNPLANEVFTRRNNVFGEQAL